MTMDLDMDSPGGLDWTQNAFFSLNADSQPTTSAAWPAFSSSPAFTIPPSLLTDAAMERHGQITPPEDGLPDQQKMQLLQNYEPQQDNQTLPARASKRQRTAKPKATPKPAQQQDSEQNAQNPQNPQPPKRKRGRPKSQPQTVEAFTADGYPFQVTSARQSHLEKNRVAAHKCRQRKKEYIGNLETRAREHSAKNKALKENVAKLREEVLELKNEVLRHAGCDFWAVDEYLARCAGDLLGVAAPLGMPGSQQRSQTATSAMNTPTLRDMEREPSTTESLPSQAMSDAFSQNDFGGLDLLEDLDEEEGERDA